MDASKQMQAVQVLCRNSYLSKILIPFMDIERDEIKWDSIPYHSLSGGYQVAISWAYCLFCDVVPPLDWDYRDPFGSFSVMDRDIQVLIFEAMAIRHGYLSITIEDVPPSPFRKLLLQGEVELNKSIKKKGLRILSNNEESSSENITFTWYSDDLNQRRALENVNCHIEYEGISSDGFRMLNITIPRSELNKILSNLGKYLFSEGDPLEVLNTKLKREKQ